MIFIYNDFIDFTISVVVYLSPNELIDCREAVWTRRTPQDESSQDDEDEEFDDDYDEEEELSGDSDKEGNDKY